jgi:hypothetical protein
VLPGFLLTLAAGAVVVAVVLVTSGSSDDGPAPSTTTPPPATSDEGRPPPHPEATTPLGTPPSVAEDGTYAFRHLQDGTDDPVAWDPCRPIPVVVSSATAPRDADELLDQALGVVAEATGLRFEVEGPTDERPTSDDRPLVQTDRYGDRWAPVLVAWTDPATVPELRGTVGGLGGSAYVTAPDGTQVYVSGSLLLDGPQMEESMRVVGGRDQVRTVLLHELGHVLGLAHVEDRSELMHPEGQPGAATYGPGDRAGLARLGQGPCAPDL